MLRKRAVIESVNVELKNIYQILLMSNSRCYTNFSRVISGNFHGYAFIFSGISRPGEREVQGALFFIFVETHHIQVTAYQVLGGGAGEPAVVPGGDADLFQSEFRAVVWD